MSAVDRDYLIIAVREDNDAKVNTLINEFGISHSKALSTAGHMLLREAIIVAVEEGHLKIIEDLLNHGADVDSLIPNGISYTLLHEAANNDQFEIVKLLINHGADVNAKDAYGYLPICFAVNNKNVEMTRLLLSSGTEIKYCRDLLNLAVKRRCKEIFYMILSISGLDVNNRDDNIWPTALHCTAIPTVDSCDFGDRRKKYDTAAADAGFSSRRIVCDEASAAGTCSYVDVACEMAEAILSRGADVNAQCENGETALHYAVHYEQIGVIEILLKHKADVNSMDIYRETPLHYSAKCDNDEIMIILLNNGACINHKNLRDETPLIIACIYGNEKIVTTLLEFGADIYSTLMGVSSPLWNAVLHGHNGVVEILLKHEANVRSMTEFKKTPLRHSVKRDIETITRMRLTNAIETSDKIISELDIARRTRREIILATLLYFEADIDRRHQIAWLALRFAVQYIDLTIVKNILKLYDVIELPDEFGRTILHTAVEHNRPNVTNELLEHGYDINVTCNVGRTPFEYICCRTVGPSHRIFCMSGADCHSTRLIKVINRHIVKLKALNMHVSSRNLNLIDVENDHKDFYDDCRLEVKKSKDERISDTNVTFHDLMTNDIDKLALRARNSSIVKTLESGKYKEKYPIYGNMMFNNFKKGEKRERLLSRSAKSLNFLLGFTLNEISSAKVLNNLSNKELEKLIKAGDL